MIDPNDEEAMSRSLKNDAEFERVLREYKKVIQGLKLRCLEKYGPEIVKMFGM